MSGDGHQLHALHVFVDEHGQHGNALGVFLDGPSIDPAERQAIAADLGYSETVFVDDGAAGRLAIFTPSVELPFAGHPLVGSAWLLGRECSNGGVLRPPAGEVRCRLDPDGVAWITARASQSPAWELEQQDTAAAVEQLDGPPTDSGHVLAWAWQDEAAGRVRTRAFASAYGIPEDPATGSASVVLCSRLGRALAIRQGTGSEIVARPLPGDEVDLGGRVVLDEVRRYQRSG